MKKVKGRHELKHRINKGDFLELSSKLKHIATPDENSKEGSAYKIRSLYFDTYDDRVMREKVDGLSKREKFRIRYYNNDTGFIRLEKKSKINSICYKENEKITALECSEILKGNYEVLNNKDKPLFLELYSKMQYQGLRPKNIVEYYREAYIYKMGNVRITLDYNIASSNNVSGFLDSKLFTVKIPNAMVLEVKYDEFLPEVIRGVTSLRSRRAASFSKYTETRANY
ncbi:MAG: polyphosphate polymerase domain-containing protein [Anaerotignum sp.]